MVNKCAWCGNTEATTTRALIELDNLFFCHYTHAKDYNKYNNITKGGTQ